MAHYDDPFAGGERTPSLSFKGLPIGSTFTLRVTEAAKAIQNRDFETNEPAFWDAACTQPKMSAVVKVEVISGPHSVGEARSVWAQKPSDLFSAIARAQQEAKAKIAPGGTLLLKFAGETPHTNARYSPIKNYAAKYTPPQGVDAFAEAPNTAPAGWGQRGPASPTQPALPGTTRAAYAEPDF